MNGKNFIEHLQAKLRSVLNKENITNKDLADFFNVTQQTIVNWTNNSNIRAAEISKFFVNGIETAQKQARHNAIRPIVEFFPVVPCKSQSGKRWELFSIFTIKGQKHLYRSGLREKLAKANGVYLFYDSRGRALYSGKAKNTSLWKEMNSALNRKRTLQTVFRVKHPNANVNFNESGEINRQISSQSVQLFEMTEYISAYETAREMIDIFESILIRSFANDLLNIRMEKFGGGDSK